MTKKDEYINEAYQALLNLSADEQKMLEYEARQKALRDHMALISTAENRGLKQGLEQGLELKLLNQVCKKMRRNCSVTEIADMLEEEPEVIQRIYDAATAFAPDYDVKQIMEKLKAGTDVSLS